MSYILDALTKAAKARDGQASALQRLLRPAPKRSSAWTRLSTRLLVALGLNALLLAGVLVAWLRFVPAPAPLTPVAVPEQAQPPRLRPDRIPTATSPQPALSAPATRPPTPAARRAPEPAVAPSVAPAAPATPPEPAITQPGTPAPPAAPPDPAGLKVEALVYSDAPARRMIFISGRKYVEGDLIDGRLRVEEIREDGVTLSEQGRRFTLRVTR
jgi:hypothetical protein